ncbi:subtilisin-like protease SBT3 [Vigna umbellata]|uniref:subtilisin-like protease SBT3 n=1 Tax=Vigna umbellata TaxID=87088 RepID=UPI001F5FDD94|nr:subtilisin-like protease SBT3 [Vigna umbellata]
MATMTRFVLCFSCIVILNLVYSMAQSDNYIIHMDKLAMPKAFSTHHAWYLSTLSSVLDNAHTFNDDNLDIASSKLIYTYTNAMNGFTANLSPQEIEALKTSPGYVSSTPDLPTKLDTTHSPEFLGLNPNTGAWPAAKFGEDVIVGLVDTGVWPESESFNDKGMPDKLPSRWYGKCESTIKCNKKLIGARFFNKGFLAKNSKSAKIVHSTRDTDGHGTHTSSTAVGSQVVNASFFGNDNGSAKGVAPRARVAIYKVLWGEMLYASDLIAAVDAAISDGVDILSLSLGYNVLTLFEDPMAIATFAAMDRGIFVSTSAGNSGPKRETLHNGIPWVINVAAGTLDRQIQASLTLGNGVKLFGLSTYLLGNFSAHQVPIVFSGSCDNFTELVKARNKIVVCEVMDANLPNLVYNIKASNVLASVFISTFNDVATVNELGLVGVIVNPRNGETIKAYIKSNSDAKASMSFQITTLGIKPAPRVDRYSSRGPSISCPFVLKPDITAPGTSILAAWPENLPVSSPGSIPLYSNFNLLSGTSMACPHMAGVAALLKGAHRDWSPAAIRSAIMTTSDIFDNNKEPIKDIGDGDKPASPLVMGAGHVNPNKALDPGLVYDAGAQDYVNLLCAMNLTQQHIKTITRSSSYNCSKPSLDLNYPSFIALFSENGSSKQSMGTWEFFRTVTNVGEGQTIYTARVTPIKGFNVSITPSKLVFKEKNQKLNYKLRIEGPKREGFGYVTWTDVKHVVRSPIVITYPPSQQ